MWRSEVWTHTTGYYTTQPTTLDRQWSDVLLNNSFYSKLQFLFFFCFYIHAGSSGGPTLARGSWRDFSVKTNFNYCDSNTCSTWGMFQKWDISAAGSVARVHPEPTAAIFVLFSLSWENRVLWDWYLTHCGGGEETITAIKFNESQ